MALRPRPDSEGGYRYPSGWQKRPSSFAGVVSSWLSLGALGLVIPDDAVVIDGDRREDGEALRWADIPALFSTVGEPDGWYRSGGPNDGFHAVYSREGFDRKAGHRWCSCEIVGDVKASGLVHIRGDRALSVWCDLVESRPSRCLDWGKLGQHRGGDGGGGSGSFGGMTAEAVSAVQSRRGEASGRARHRATWKRDKAIVALSIAGAGKLAIARELGLRPEMPGRVLSRVLSGRCGCWACRGLHEPLRSTRVAAEQTGGETQNAKKLEVKPKTEDAFPVAV